MKNKDRFASLRLIRQESLLIREQLDELHERLKNAADAESFEKYVKLCRRLYEKNIELDRQYAETIELIDTLSDSLMRQLLTLRFIKGLSWRAVACRLGGGNTEDGVRKMYARFSERL